MNGHGGRATPAMARDRAAALVPGATLGVLGAGQLGRMFAAAAVRMGYRVHVFAPDAEGSPASAHAERVCAAPYEDEEALGRFARACDAVTLEFENVPLAALEAVARHAPVRPGRDALRTAQHRLREKRFLAAAGIPHAPFAEVVAESDLPAALAAVGTPAILKTAGFGYDGKGQSSVDRPAAATAAWRAQGGVPAVLEARIELAAEVSVVVARGTDGAEVAYRPLRNRHRDGILDLTSWPAAVDAAVESAAEELAREVARALDVVGVVCIEFFLGRDGSLRVNEIAPRPHNSGHLTLEAAATSQFEQQVRAVAGLPLGDTRLQRPAAMANLLGEVWTGGEPDWPAALAVPGVALHLYGKAQPRPGRKMGHLTALAGEVGVAVDQVLRARSVLART